MPALPNRRDHAVADEALVRTLFEEHGNAILAYATRLLGDRAAAEDIVQEALVRAWRHPEVLVNGKGSVRAWLFTVVRNLVTDTVRARKARPQEVAETPMSVPVQKDHSQQVVDSMFVLRALDRLSAEHREVLEHTYLRGLTIEQTARELEIPVGTVKSRSFKALRALRDRFSVEHAELRRLA